MNQLSQAIYPRGGTHHGQTQFYLSKKSKNQEKCKIYNSFQLLTARSKLREDKNNLNMIIAEDSLTIYHVLKK